MVMLVGGGQEWNGYAETKEEHPKIGWILGGFYDLLTRKDISLSVSV
jgi:hypothetical protein